MSNVTEKYSIAALSKLSPITEQQLPRGEMLKLLNSTLYKTGSGELSGIQGIPKGEAIMSSEVSKLFFSKDDVADACEWCPISGTRDVSITAACPDLACTPSVIPGPWGLRDSCHCRCLTHWYGQSSWLHPLCPSCITYHSSRCGSNGRECAGCLWGWDVAQCSEHIQALELNLCTGSKPQGLQEGPRN